MENIVLDVINEQVGGDKGDYIIDTDARAEWALQKIAEEEKDAKRMIKVCSDMIEEYKLKIDTLKNNLEGKTNYYRTQLNNYLGLVKANDTKTQLSYKLPSATLIYKKPSPTFDRDDKVLVQWLESNNMNELVKVEKKPDWAALKKLTTEAGGKVVTSDGEIVDGVTIKSSEGSYEIKFNK